MKLLHPNTIEVQFNILRTLVHRAIEVGIMDAAKDPFLIFKYKGVKTDKDRMKPELRHKGRTGYRTDARHDARANHVNNRGNQQVIE